METIIQMKSHGNSIFINSLVLVSVSKKSNFKKENWNKMSSKVYFIKF